jgi:HK97 family phage prohead protease
MHEVSQSPDRTNEQNVAICLDKWHEVHPRRAASNWVCGASRDLPIAETERAWDGSAAAKRMLDRANIGEEEGAKPEMAKLGFLIYDRANGELRGSYSCPFADIVDGTLKVIPSGLRAAASRLPQVTDVSQSVKDRARGVLDAYFARLEDNDDKGANDDKSTKQDYDGYDAPDVAPGESQDRYIERCVMDLERQGADEGDASRLCHLAWMNRTYSRLRHKTHAETVQGMDFVLSDESEDRMGDVISAAGWDLTNFLKNPIALFGHRNDFVIGTWEGLRSEKNALRGKLKLAPAGTSERIDEIRKLIEAGILKAVSVGFRPITSVPRRDGDKYVGEHFTRQELIETSVVSVPANPNALAIAKSLDISTDTMDLVFGKHAAARPIRKIGGSFAEHGASNQKLKERSHMSALTQQISQVEAEIVGVKDKLKDFWNSVDQTNVTDVEMQTAQDLNEEHARLDKLRTTLKESEKFMMETGEQEHRQLALRTNGGGNGSGSGEIRRPNIQTDRRQMPKTKEERLDIIARVGVITVLSHIKKLNPEATRQFIAAQYSRYADEGTKAFLDYIGKAPSAPAMTTVDGWAAELVQQIHADYMELLQPDSVFPRLSALGLSLQFGRAGRIVVPTRSRTPSISGSFVGEGQPIPVRQAAFTAQILTPKKMAVISTWTREIDESSIPAIEGLLRSAIQEDTAVTLDSILMDADDADAIRPAGLQSQNPIAGPPPNGSGATEVLPAAIGAAGPFGALVDDLKALIGALLGPTQGNVRRVVLLMNPQQKLSISLTAMPGVSAFPFMDAMGRNVLLDYTVIGSGTVPAGKIIAIDAADFVTVGGEAPRFEVSDQATLHMEDSTPGPIHGSTPVRSLWQTDSLGLRLILPINWCMRRDGMVAFVENIAW